MLAKNELTYVDLFYSMKIIKNEQANSSFISLTSNFGISSSIDKSLRKDSKREIKQQSIQSTRKIKAYHPRMILIYKNQNSY